MMAFIARWEVRQEEFNRLDAYVKGARLLAEMLAELRVANGEHDEELFNLAQAAAESGYSPAGRAGTSCLLTRRTAGAFPNALPRGIRWSPCAKHRLPCTAGSPMRDAPPIGRPENQPICLLAG
jgi:hypothetical protein